MFGVSRKKKSASKQLLSFADEDAEEDDTTPLQERKRKRKDKKKKSTMLSFDPSDGVEEGEKKKRKHKKNRGMGYGGLSILDEEEENVNVDDVNPTDSLYDNAALEKLKMEQMRRKEAVINDSDTVDKQQTTGRKHAVDEGDDMEEEYISLSGTKSSQFDPVVLAGDEALACAQQEDEPFEFDHGLGQPTSVKQPTPMEIDDKTHDKEKEEDIRQWEDNMARRAGVLPNSSTNDSNQNREQAHQTSTLTSLSQIRFSLEPTMKNLQNVSYDLETAFNHHESIISTTRDELSKHQYTLEDHGTALEYYQELRAELAEWMGALRQIKSMVDVVIDAKNNWEGDVTLTMFQRGYEWSEDVRDVLRKKCLLERTIGGEDEEHNTKVEDGGVDEFGRDLSSMATIARTKRWEERKRNVVQRKTNEKSDNEQELMRQVRLSCRSSDNISFDDIQDWKQRNQALKEAAGIISSIVNDDYLSVSNLCNLFFQWQDKYPEDYNRSYAEMTLINMVSILVKLEICQHCDGLGLAEWVYGDGKYVSQSFGNIAKFKCFQELIQATKNRSNKLYESAKLVQGVMEQCILSQLFAYLTVDSAVDQSDTKKYHGLYDPASVNETEWLCKSIRSLQTMPFHQNFVESNMTKVATSLLSLLKHYVEKKRTVMINTNNLVLVKDGFTMKNGQYFDDETTDVISYTLYSQPNELCMVATNVLTYWYPIMNSIESKDTNVTNIILFVLMEIISLRILPILNSFQTIVEASGSDAGLTFDNMQRSLVGTLFSAVKSAGLLERQEFMLSTAPLRAAAERFAI